MLTSRDNTGEVAMRRQHLIIPALLCCALAGPTRAQGGGASTIPNGPNGENASLAALRSYEQVLKALQSSVDASHGASTLHYARWTSNTGRQVPYVLIGTGPTAVMIIAQQHGDEMETSDSAVNLVRTLT